MSEQPVVAHDDDNFADDESDSGTGADTEAATAEVESTATGELPGPASASAGWGGAGTSPGGPDHGEDIWDSPSLHGGSGWMQADYTATRFIFGAAYSAARYEGPPVDRMDCSWHRPDDHDVQPLGHNSRGDIAPPQVHAALSRILVEVGETSHLVQKLAHGVADKVWLLHSRSSRLEKAVASAFDFLPASAQVGLVEMMRFYPLKDMRLVAATVDPREKPVYGATLDSPAMPRWREIFLANRNNPDWDSGPGGISGSSPEASGVMPHATPYSPLSVSDEERQMRRWADRRTRRLARSAKLAADRANQAQVATEELLARQLRAETLQDILLRGVAAERGPLPLTEPQRARAWYEDRAREAATGAEFMPMTP